MGVIWSEEKQKEAFTDLDFCFNAGYMMFEKLLSIPRVAFFSHP